MDPVTMALLFGGVGAGTQLLGAKNQAEQQKRNMLANAEQIRYSPWTGLKAGIEGGKAYDPTTAAIGGAAQGALSGAMFGQQFSKGSTPEVATEQTKAFPQMSEAEKSQMDNSIAMGQVDPRYTSYVERRHMRKSPWLDMSIVG